MYPFSYPTKVLRKKILALRGVQRVVVEHKARNLGVYPLQFLSLKSFLWKCVFLNWHTHYSEVGIRKDTYALEEVYPNISNYCVD